MKYFLLISLVCCYLTTYSQFNNYSQSIDGAEEKIEMIAINGGVFSMGSPDSEIDRSSDEGPVNNVKIESFWMAVYEITWDIYRLFMERKIDIFQPDFNSSSEVVTNVDGVTGATTPYTDMSFGMGTDGYPAVCMTHLAATKFCEWLSAMTGHFYRLPTEAEWEYACRANTQSAYSFGSKDKSIDQYAWHQENSNESYHKVGEKLPNPWGLYDMHGNVAEWTLDQYISDVYSSYTQDIVQSPYIKPTKTYPRVVRGGSWKDKPSKLRSAARRASTKSWKIRDPQIPKSKWWHTDAPFVGFRIVRPTTTPSPSEQKQYWGYK